MAYPTCVNKLHITIIRIMGSSYYTFVQIFPELHTNVMGLGWLV